MLTALGDEIVPKDDHLSQAPGEECDGHDDWTETIERVQNRTVRFITEEVNFKAFTKHIVSSIKWNTHG